MFGTVGSSAGTSVTLWWGMLMVKEAVHPKEIIIGRVDMSCGANIGPGMAVVFYYGKEASEGLAEEKKIMEEIANAK